MPKRHKFEYAQLPVFNYQTFDRATLSFTDHPIIPSERIIFSDRIADEPSEPQDDAAEPGIVETEPVTVHVNDTLTSEPTVSEKATADEDEHTSSHEPTEQLRVPDFLRDIEEDASAEGTIMHEKATIDGIKGVPDEDMDKSEYRFTVADDFVAAEEVQEDNMTLQRTLVVAADSKCHVAPVESKPVTVEASNQSAEIILSSETAAQAPRLIVAIVKQLQEDHAPAEAVAEVLEEALSEADTTKVMLPAITEQDNKSKHQNPINAETEDIFTTDVALAPHVDGGKVSTVGGTTGNIQDKVIEQLAAPIEALGPEMQADEGTAPKSDIPENATIPIDLKDMTTEAPSNGVSAPAEVTALGEPAGTQIAAAEIVHDEHNAFERAESIADDQPIAGINTSSPIVSPTNDEVVTESIKKDKSPETESEGVDAAAVAVKEFSDGTDTPIGEVLSGVEPTAASEQAAETPVKDIEEVSVLLDLGDADVVTVASAAKEEKRRKKHHVAEKYFERDRQMSIMNGHKTRLQRRKEEKGVLVNTFAMAIGKAKEEQEIKHNSLEYQEKQKRKRERKEAKEAAEREERKAQREPQKLDDESNGKVEVEGRRRRRAGPTVAKAEGEILSESNRNSPKLSMSDSGSGGGSSHVRLRPGLLKRITTGESELGGPLLMINMNKEAGGEIPHSAPHSPKEKGTSEHHEHRRHRSHISGSSTKPGHEYASDGGHRKHHHHHHSDRPSASRHGSSRGDKDDEPSSFGKVLKSVFVK